MFFEKKLRTWSFVSMLSTVLIFTLIVSACSSGEEDSDQETSNEGEVTYTADVEEIISNNCLSCHGSESPTMAEFDQNPEEYEAKMQGPRMDDYENLVVVVNGSEAGALMRRLDNGENTDDGEPGNMYEYLGETDEEREENLETLKEWVGHWTLKRENELTDEDMEKFKIAE